jgi:F-type H+-transporting ATPase subunit epsilon
MALTLEIVTPERRILEVRADEVRAPGVQGGFGIRERHAPFMTALEAGRLTYVAGGQEHHYAIGGGFLQVLDDKVIVLADSAEARDDIDVEAAKKALAESSERLRTMTEQDEDYAVEAAKVRRETARITVAGR